VIGCLVRYGKDGSDAMTEGVVKEQRFFHRSMGTVRCDVVRLALGGAFVGRVCPDRLRHVYRHQNEVNQE
jgi:hypothetical protein